MKKFKKLLCIVLSLILMLNFTSLNLATSMSNEQSDDNQVISTESNLKENERDSKQETKENKEEKAEKEENTISNELDIAMINYLAVKTYELSENKEDFVELENIQNLIRNGINLEALKNENIHEFVIKDFLPTITKFKLDSKSRVRVMEKLNEKKAQAITQGILATSQAMTSIDTSNIAGGIVGGIGAAATGASTTVLALQDAKSENKDLNFDLDQGAIENIDNLNTQLLHYMINMHVSNNIENNKFLRDQDIKDFYEAKKSNNIQNKIDKLESAENKLSGYGAYWLELSRAYYQKAIESNNNDFYRKCITAFEKYEEVGTEIFNDGMDLEKYDFILSYLESIEKVKLSEYVNIASKYAKILDEDLGISIENWDKKLYLVSLYEKLYSKTNDKVYLNNAYEIQRKLTLEVATQLKEKNKILDNTDEPYAYDDAVAISLIKLKDLTEKVAKTEEEKELLDNDIFGSDYSLFYNYFIDREFVLSEKYKEFYTNKIDNITDYIYIRVSDNSGYISIDRKYIDKTGYMYVYLYIRTKGLIRSKIGEKSYWSDNGINIINIDLNKNESIVKETLTLCIRPYNKIWSDYDSVPNLPPDFRYDISYQYDDIDNEFKIIESNIIEY